MEKKPHSVIKNIIAVLIACIIVAGAVFCVLNYDRIFAQAEPEADAEISEAVSYITKLEGTDTKPIEDQIFKEDHFIPIEKLEKQFRKNPETIWKTLKEYDTLIMGDSRAQCFLLYDYMDQQHCLVESSTTIYKIKDYIKEVKERKPRVIVISYGINDTGLYHDYGVEKYTKDFADMIDDLKKADPGVKVYVNSILPCLESEYDRAPNWMVIPDWNKYIKKYCKEHDIGYIDATEVCNQHRDLYISDGVHFESDFYPYWGAVIAATIVSDYSMEPED